MIAFGERADQCHHRGRRAVDLCGSRGRQTNINDFGTRLGTTCRDRTQVEFTSSIDRLKSIASLEPDDAGEIAILGGIDRDVVAVDLTRGNGDALQGV